MYFFEKNQLVKNIIWSPIPLKGVKNVAKQRKLSLITHHTVKRSQKCLPTTATEFMKLSVVITHTVKGSQKCLPTTATEFIKLSVVITHTVKGSQKCLPTTATRSLLNYRWWSPCLVPDHWWTAGNYHRSSTSDYARYMVKKSGWSLIGMFLPPVL